MGRELDPIVVKGTFDIKDYKFDFKDYKFDDYLHFAKIKKRETS